MSIFGKSKLNVTSSTMISTILNYDHFTQLRQVRTP